MSDLYSSPSIIRIIKSRRMRWAGHAARMGEKLNARAKARGKKDHYEDQDVDGRIILKDGVVGTGLIWLRVGTCGSLL
jgi:hypothetical protein